MNTTYMLEAPFFVFKKKHYCFNCNQLLEVKNVSKIVNSKSPEAKDFDFSCSDSLFGSIKYFYNVFYCKNCNIYYSIKELIEKYNYLKMSKKINETDDTIIMKAISKKIKCEKIILNMIVFILIILFLLFIS